MSINELNTVKSCIENAWKKIIQTNPVTHIFLRSSLSMESFSVFLLFSIARRSIACCISIVIG